MKGKIKDRYSRVKWVIGDDNVPFLDLSYAKSGDKKKITELLLLFNLEYIVKQCLNKSLIIKFPFKSFKEDHWHVEHIDSYTENPLSDRATQIEWLKTSLIDLQDELDEVIINRINSFINDDKSKESFELIQNEIITVAGENNNDENTKNNIGNLTLLDAETNCSYGNALFPSKRRIIIEKDREGRFIPICTKNVFLKYFDLNGNSRTKWSLIDIINYRNIVAETLIDFLPTKPKIATINE